MSAVMNSGSTMALIKTAVYLFFVGFFSFGAIASAGDMNGYFQLFLFFLTLPWSYGAKMLFGWGVAKSASTFAIVMVFSIGTIINAALIYFITKARYGARQNG